MTTAESLTCPKCHGSMRSYERNSVVIDQCTECRGVFLDRGELERIMDAEDRQANLQQPPAVSWRDDDRRYYQQPGGHHGDSKHGGAKRRRGGFFGELFD